MIPAEILTMAGGSIVGFFFKLVAKRAENEQKRFEMIMRAKKILWGLLGTRTEPVFVEIEGYLLVPEIRQALTAIVGFYFGQATVKR